MEEYSWAHAVEGVSAPLEDAAPAAGVEPAASASLLKDGSVLSYKIFTFWEERYFIETLPGSTHMTTASAGSLRSNCEIKELCAAFDKTLSHVVSSNKIALFTRFSLPKAQKNFFC